MKSGNLVVGGIIFGSVLFLGLMLYLVTSDKIEPGYIGIKVNNYGNQRGVEDYPVVTGRVFINPLTTDIYKYPTFMQNKIWSKQGAFSEDESITINSQEGSSINCDIGIAYTLKAELVPHMFVEFRQRIDEITHGYLRNQVRDIMNRHSPKYKAVEIIGDKKQDLLEEVKKELQEKLEPKGFMIDTISFVSAPVPDPKVMQSITSVIEATQKAIEAENKVKQIEAEARQEIARAEGKAKAILAEATAQAEANRLLTESITPVLVLYKTTEKWNGIPPQVVGIDPTVLMNLNK